MITFQIQEHINRQNYSCSIATTTTKRQKRILHTKKQDLWYSSSTQIAFGLLGKWIYVADLSIKD